MGKQSTRENKTIYQICREEAGLTRAEASERMTAVSDSIARPENNAKKAVLQSANCKEQI